MRLSASFRRLVAFAVIISMVLTGCASRPYYVAPDLPDRANQIASIAIVPIDVKVFRVGLRGEQFSDEWSETARTNLRNAIAKYFGSDLHFAVREFDPKEMEAAQQQALDQVHNQMERIDPTLIHKGVVCLPRPTAPTLADATGTDALLLVYASDRILTAGMWAVVIAGVVVALPLLAVILLFPPFWGSLLHGLTHPPSGPTELRLAALDAITLCLVDSRTGEALWFDLQRLGRGNLRDASKVERLIGNVYTRFREGTHQ